MAKPKTPKLEPHIEYALQMIHPNREEALKLVKLGLFYLPKRKRLRYGKCGARTKRYGGRPCQAPATKPAGRRPGRCKLHGGKSTGPRTKKGMERCGPL